MTFGELTMSNNDFIKKAFDFVKMACETSSYDVGLDMSVFSDIGKYLSLSKQDSEIIARYLAGKGLVKYTTYMGETEASISVTSKGIDTVIEAVSHPDKPTAYFPPINIYNYGNVTQIGKANGGVQVSQGSPGSVQTINNSNLKEMLDIICILENHMDILGSDEEKRNALLSDMQTIKAQANSPTPKESVIKECWPSIKEFAIQAGAGVLGTLLYAKLFSGL
jgi:hypothetical protein